MRLTQTERRAIREAVAEVFGSSAVVRLFGSRTRDNIVGGDVDLHIETDPLPELETFARERRLWSMLREALDEAKVDILVTPRGRDLRPIEKVAYRDGLLV